jgi:uncharacterized protein (TIGR02466 family)
MVNAVPLFASPLMHMKVKENTDQLQKSYEYKKTDTYFKNSMSEDVRILKKFPRIEKIFLKYFDKIAKEVFLYDETFRITTSWIAKTEDSQSEMHNHKNSFYSGVYYFDDYTEDSGSLQFKNPLFSHSDFNLTPREWNIMNSCSWNISPEKNLLIFFPSYLEHRVINNKGKRRSLAFNIVPIGEYGTGDSSIDTSWLR